MEAAIEAIRAEGTGTTGSRIANGSYSEHVALEKEIAEFYGKKHCMVFTTGYQANLGVISTLVGPERLPADRRRQPRLDLRRLQADPGRGRALQAQRPGEPRRAPAPASGDKPGNRLVVLEGIYSMLGDSAPLKEFIEVCKKYGAYVLVDEAHSLGALGENGRGLCEAAGVLDDCHFIVGTFSKTLGAIGGYCVSERSGLRHPARDHARLHVHGLAAALDRGVGPPGAEGGEGAGPSCASSCGTTSPRSMTAWRPRASSSVPSTARWSACTCPTA